MPLRLLLVDDNRSFLASARALLEREGLEVVAAVPDGSEAISAAASAEVDVALIDVDLDHESGATVARRLATARPALRIILISAYPAIDLPGVVAQTPALGFIHKPALSRQAIEDLLNAEISEIPGT